jgi:hypothetical protein
MKANGGMLLWVISAVVTVAGGSGGQTNQSGDGFNGGADANDTYFPIREDRLVNRERTMFEAIDPAVLAKVEADARKTLENGGPPPAWQNLVPKLTREECAKMTTDKLAQACFSSGYLTRRLLASNSGKHVYTLISVKVWYPCYGELFEREDLWKVVLDAYSMYASRLDPKRDPNTVIDGSMGLDTLGDLFQLPKVQEQLRGKETQFVRAQLDALKKVRRFIGGDPNDAMRSSTPFFSLRVPVSLIEDSLVFMRRASPSQSAPVVAKICKISLSRRPTMGQVKAYIDAVTPEIEQFLKFVTPLKS